MEWIGLVIGALIALLIILGFLLSSAQWERNQLMKEVAILNKRIAVLKMELLMERD